MEKLFNLFPEILTTIEELCNFPEDLNSLAFSIKLMAFFLFLDHKTWLLAFHYRERYIGVLFLNSVGLATNDQKEKKNFHISFPIKLFTQL